MSPRYSLVVLGLLAGSALQAGTLRFFNVPGPTLPASWTGGVGLPRRAYDPLAMLERIQGAGPLGEGVLEAIRRSRMRAIHCVFLDVGSISPSTRRAAEAVGVSTFREALRPDALAVWIPGDRGGVVAIRLDTVRKLRRNGERVTPAGALAHGLVHVGQTIWGSVDPDDPSHGRLDLRDEAEALLLQRVVDRAELLSYGPVAGTDPGERRLLNFPARPTEATLQKLVDELRPERPWGRVRPHYAPGYDATLDPFSRLG